jgi:hypothetical protein
MLQGLAAVQVFGSENGRSTYSPGTQGDFSLAVLPEQPGFYLRNETLYYSGRNTFDMAGGGVGVVADLSAVVNIPRLTWSSGWEILGARYGAYLSVPFAYVDVETTVRQRKPGGGEIVQQREGDRFGFTDFYLAPVMLDWTIGSVDLMLLETATIPSGAYESDAFVNISRNYFALNSSVAATWRHPDGGPELDLRVGYILNAENPATDYRTGDELVADWTAAWRFDTNWSLGLTGYAYEQVTGDSGDGASLGGFKGRSVGLGPIVRYILTAGDRRFSLVAKWIHEIDARNRFEGDLFFLAIATRL